MTTWKSSHRENCTVRGRELPEGQATVEMVEQLCATPGKMIQAEGELFARKPAADIKPCQCGHDSKQERQKIFRLIQTLGKRPGVVELDIARRKGYERPDVREMENERKEDCHAENESGENRKWKETGEQGWKDG